MSFKKFKSFVAVLPTMTFVALVASAAILTPSGANASVEPALVQQLSQTLLGCVVQPYGINARTGNKVFGALRSQCAGVTISQDRAILKVDGRNYTVLVKDSALSDDGDLNDLFVEYDSREDQEVQLASNLLSFGDPALSILMLSGHRASELPQVEDSSLNQLN